MLSISKRPRSLTNRWYTVPLLLEQLQGRFWNLAVFSSFSRIFVARCMQRRHDECTAAMSTRALNESDGPSNFHLHKTQTPKSNRMKILKSSRLTMIHNTLCCHLTLWNPLHTWIVATHYIIASFNKTFSISQILYRVSLAWTAWQELRWMRGSKTTEASTVKRRKLFKPINHHIIYLLLFKSPYQLEVINVVFLKLWCFLV